MSFLVLLLALLLEKFSAARQRIQRDGFWLQWLSDSEAKGRAPEVVLAMLVLLPVLLLGCLLLAIEPVLYGWLALPVHLLVMMYCLGRGDVLAALGPFRDAWRRGDGEAAYLVAARDLGVDGEDNGDLLRQVQGHLLWEGYQGFFAVIFWYALLGPLVALAYRLLALAATHAGQESLRALALRMRHAMDWLPVRVLAVSFGLVGNFVEVNRTLLHELLSWDIPASKLLLDCGLSGADLADADSADTGVASLDSIWQLLIRCAVVWYGVIALGTVFWLS